MFNYNIYTHELYILRFTCNVKCAACDLLELNHDSTVTTLL